ncbi:MAG: ABC transporter permease subunit [Candidatus Poribacteria bacterium]|nr:ABC transporter permease subunit [Candidatus Poribacteria bacterium]
MIWHITRRELYDNLNSLRFALTTVLLLGLMLTNAVVHLREHPERIQKYREGVAAYQNRLKSYAEESLYRLAQKGPGDLYKKPALLRFCAEGGETFLADHTSVNHRWSTDTLESFWILTYPSGTLNVNNVRPEVTKVDWDFIIGYVLSLIALLFTFDAVSGERENGTLRLTLANPISRYALLIGKFLGALISVSIPFTLAILVNLLVVSTSSDVYLDAAAWGRLGIIFLIALVYTCLFLALGLLVSARVRRSGVSLVILLLVWVTFVVFIPNTLISIVGGFSSSKSTHGLSERSWQLHLEILDEYYDRRRDVSKNLTEEIQLGGEIVTKEAEQQAQLRAERLNQRIFQVNQARTITRFSPVTIFQHLLESFAGTGFERHLQFLRNVQSHARQFQEFVVDTDRTDPESLHIFGVRDGMSQKSVPIEAVPKFEDTLSLSKDFNTAAINLLLLTFFVIVLLSGAYLVFVRVEV